MRLNDNPTFPVLWQHIGNFWRWWARELTQAFIPLGRILWRKDKARTLVVLSKALQGGSEALQAALDASSWQHLRDLLGRIGKRAEPLTLQLDPDLYLSRIATYPAGALAKLDSIVALDVETSTPFDHDSALWKWRVLEKRDGQLRVETVILRRSHILKMLELADDAGMEVAEIVASGVTSARPLRLLKLTTTAGRKRRFWRRINLGLLSLITLVTIALLTTAYHQQQKDYRHIDQVLAIRKANAIRWRKAQSNAQARFESNVMLLREKAATPSRVGIWNALSETLPETVWLSEFQINDKTGRISGFAKSAAPLIEKLETLESLSNVTFVSPVTINPDDRSERFDISFTLEERHE